MNVNSVTTVTVETKGAGSSSVYYDPELQMSVLRTVTDNGAIRTAQVMPLHKLVELQKMVNTAVDQMTANPFCIGWDTWNASQHLNSRLEHLAVK